MYTRIDPDHGNRTTPLYDTGATARFVLRQWDRAAARDAAAADIAAGRTAAVVRFADAAAGGTVRDGIADAFRAASPAALAAQRAAVEDALAQGRRVDTLGLALAERLADAAADEATRRRLVLALKLDASPAARDALGRFAKADSGSALLRQEVRQWLER